MNIDITGKVALVTGGSSGIGKSATLAFAAAGLCSDASPLITAIALPVDGGYLAV